MSDRLCDWQGCDSPHVQPVYLGVDREDGDPEHVRPLGRRFELCPAHTEALVHWVSHTPWHEPPFDEGAGS